MLSGWRKTKRLRFQVSRGANQVRHRAWKSRFVPSLSIVRRGKKHNARQSLQSRRRARLRCSLPPPPIPLLASAFWQGLLFGNPESLIPGFEATPALYLVSDKLGISIVEGEIIDTQRGGESRKSLRERFGPASAEQAMATLWRSAPPSPGPLTDIRVLHDGSMTFPIALRYPTLVC